MEDFNDWRFICAIAETGSLSGAARRLQVNHATVFRRVQACELRLGVRLFERDGGRYTPTLAGEEMARAGALMQEAANAALLKVSGRDLRLQGLVRITTTESIAHCLLGPILQECRQRYPEIRLQVAISNEMANLSKRDADIAIRPAQKPPDYLIGKRISPLAFAVYTARSHWQAANADEATNLAQQWGTHQWIALDEAHRTVNWLAQFQDPEQIGLRINGFAAVRQACLAGLGLALLPCFMAAAEPELQQLSAPIPELSSELWLLVHPDLRQTARISAVFQLLHAALSRCKPALSGEPMHIEPPRSQTI